MVRKGSHKSSTLHENPPVPTPVPPELTAELAALDRTAIVTVEAVENMRMLKAGTNVWIRAEFAGEVVAQGLPTYLDNTKHCFVTVDAVLRWNSTNSEAIDSLLAHPMLLSVMQMEGDASLTTTSLGREGHSEEGRSEDEQVSGSKDRKKVQHGPKGKAKGRTRNKSTVDPYASSTIIGRANFDLLPLLLGETEVVEELTLESERSVVPLTERLAWTDQPRMYVRARLQCLERMEPPLGPAQQQMPSANALGARYGADTLSDDATLPAGAHSGSLIKNMVTHLDTARPMDVNKAGTHGKTVASKDIPVGSYGVDIPAGTWGSSALSSSMPRPSSAEKSPEFSVHTRPDPWEEDDKYNNGDIGDGNIIFVTLESLYAPPKMSGSISLNATGQDERPQSQMYTATTTIPVGREVYHPLTFEGGTIVDGHDGENTARWSTLHTLGTRAALTKYRLSDELAEVKCTVHDVAGNLIGPMATAAAATLPAGAPPTQHAHGCGTAVGAGMAAVEQAVEQSLITLLHHQGRRVQWNSLRRAYVTDISCNSIYALIAKYHLWPFEISLASGLANGPSCTSSIISEGRHNIGSMVGSGNTTAGLNCSQMINLSRQAPGVFLGPGAGSIIGVCPAAAASPQPITSRDSAKSNHPRKTRRDAENASQGGSAGPSGVSSRQGSRAMRQQMQKGHWVAYVDLSNLLYPGVTRTRVAAPLLPWDPYELERLCGPRGAQSVLPPPISTAPQPSNTHGNVNTGGVPERLISTDKNAEDFSASSKTQIPNAAANRDRTSGGSKGRTPSGERSRQGGGTGTPESTSLRGRPGALSPVAEAMITAGSVVSELLGGSSGVEVEGASGEPTLIVEVQLMRPLVPKRTPKDLDSGINTEVPTRAVLPKSIVSAMEAENDYRNAVEETVEIVANQFRDFVHLRHQMEPKADVTHGGSGCGKPGGGHLIVDTPTERLPPPRLRGSVNGPAAIRLAMMQSTGAPVEDVAMAEAAVEEERERERLQRQQTERMRGDVRAREATRNLRAQGVGASPNMDMKKWFTESGMEELMRQALDAEEGAGDPCCSTAPNYISCEDEATTDIFVEFLRARGVYSVLRERLRGPLAAVVNEKFATHLHQEQPLGFKRQANERAETTARVRTQNFLSDIYVFLVEEAHSMVNSFMDRGNHVQMPVMRHLQLPDRNPVMKPLGSQWTGGRGPSGERRRRTLFAEEALEDDNPNRAAQLLIQPVRDSPLDPDGWVYYAVLLLRLQERTRAIECLKEAIALCPRHRLGLMMYGVLLCESGRHQTAEIFLDSATAFYPQFVEAWVVLHLYYVRMDKTAAAEVVYGLARRSYESSLQHAEWFWRERARPLAWRARHASHMVPGTLTPPGTPAPDAPPRASFNVYTATQQKAVQSTPTAMQTFLPDAPPPSRASLDEKVAVLVPLPPNVAVMNRPGLRFIAQATTTETGLGTTGTHDARASADVDAGAGGYQPSGTQPNLNAAHHSSYTNAQYKQQSLLRTSSGAVPQGEKRHEKHGREAPFSGWGRDDDDAPEGISTESLISVFFLAAPMLIALGLYEFAELALARELETHGPSESYHYYVAALHYSKHQYGQGITHIEKAIGDNPKDPVLWALLGHCRVRIGQEPGAERAFELVHETKSTDTSPEDAHLARIRLGALWLRTNRLEPARNILRQAVAAMPTPLSWRWLGVIAFKLQNLKEAEEAFYESNMLDNTCPVTWGYLALISLIHSEERKFQQCYRMALKHNLNDAQLLHDIKVMQKLQNFTDIDGIETQDPDEMVERPKAASYVDEVLSKANVKTHRKTSSLPFL